MSKLKLLSDYMSNHSFYQIANDLVLSKFPVVNIDIFDVYIFMFFTISYWFFIFYQTTKKSIFFPIFLVLGIDLFIPYKINTNNQICLLQFTILLGLSLTTASLLIFDSFKSNLTAKNA